MLSAAEWVSRANSFRPGQVSDPQAFLTSARVGPALRGFAESSLFVVTTLPVSFQPMYERFPA
jgi:hypothetical protein